MCAGNAARLHVSDKETLAHTHTHTPAHVQVVILKYLCVAGVLVCSQTGPSGVKSKIIKPSWELLLLGFHQY